MLEVQDKYQNKWCIFSRSMYIQDIELVPVQHQGYFQFQLEDIFLWNKHISIFYSMHLGPQLQPPYLGHMMVDS